MTDINPLDYITSNANELINFTLITKKEVEDEIDNLKTSKASGPYSIPIYILKIAKQHLSRPLMEVFNNSITSGIVPESFKLAKVIPIFKKGSCLDLNNYRPISLLSVFKKSLRN